ncbi:uncharacterized protein LOC129602555 [Paramacrobiotus metropolitanus]|uniref:uncharacterized protein LOC129602555 n=1 Tax=Paramacrobiotus metropolitanus TaxID=2943436 RepID=UPI00244658C7|nr:uncharacterized protein LOC129602555 [Paramacrobiotus metropolitanus]
MYGRLPSGVSTPYSERCSPFNNLMRIPIRLLKHTFFVKPTMMKKSVLLFVVQALWIMCQIAGRSDALCSFNRGDKVPTNFECRVQSCGGAGRLTFQSDGNLVIYDGSDRPKWNSNTAGRGDQALFQTDGNLVIYDISSRTVWDSQTAGRGRRLVFQDDRNLAIYDNADNAVWSSGNYFKCN